MDRRGFLSKFKLFKKKPEEILFFGLQIVINVGSDDSIRQKLHQVINAPVTEETPQQKRAFYKRITSVLLEAEPFFDYGFWDYITDAEDAQAEFESWVAEIEGSVATEDEEMGAEVDEQFRMSGDKTYVVVTFAYVLENVASNGTFMSMIEGIGEDDYFSRAAFNTLVQSVSYLDFEYVLGDAVFIMPGNEKDGISWEELHTEGWNYLKPLA